MKKPSFHLFLISCAALTAMAQSVSITGPNQPVSLGTQYQFKALLTSVVGSATWTVSAGEGSINPNSGLYTAPGLLPASLLVTVSISAKGISANFNFHLCQPPVSITSWTPLAIPSGAFTVIVSGQNFNSKTTVALGTLPVKTKYASPNSLIISGTVPAGPTTQVALSVTNSGAGGNTFVSPRQVSIGSTSAVGNGGPPAITVAPASVSLIRSTLQAFTATMTNLSGTITWTASGGIISPSGVFTAPGGPATITVTATSSTDATVFGTASVTVPGSGNQPAITSLFPASLPFGPYTLTVNGSNFTAGSIISIDGTASHTTFVSAQQLTCTGVTLASQQGSTASVTVALGATARSAPFSMPIGVQNPQVSAAAAMRFLEQAAFGPRPADVMEVQKLGFQGWLTAQLATPPRTLYEAASGDIVGDMPARFMVNATLGADQLRQKIAFALSQFFVVSLNKLAMTKDMAPYQQMLYSNAFTTYPNLLSRVTLDPAMGVFLDMVNNDKANPATGSVANENYAREVMQLFSIGTNKLNLDGSLATVSGAAVPNYDQTTIQNFARVFTGWTFAPLPGATVFAHNDLNFKAPMTATETLHDTSAKTLLNGLVLSAGQTAASDMQAALANIVAHPNVAPFFSKFLIQHLVTSNPSPAYVTRVATIFNDDGHGIKGDLPAVITAILVDSEARAGDNSAPEAPNFGHLQEAPLYFSGIVRALNGQVDDSNYFGWNFYMMNEFIFTPPSVFNYYSPQFHVGANLAPEFQVQSPFVAVYRLNLLGSLFGADSGSKATDGPGTTIDLSPWISLADRPAALVDALDSTFTHGQMPAAMKSEIITAVTGTPGDILRVGVGIYLIVTSSLYQIMH